ALPAPPVVVLMPGIEPRAVAPGALDGGAESPVAAREHGFEQAVLRILPRELHAGLLQRIAQVGVARAQDLGAGLRGPLERRVRLGDEVGRADAHAGAAAVVRAPDLAHALRQRDDALDVLVRLGRLADHEVHLYVRPALLEGVVDRRVEVII